MPPSWSYRDILSAVGVQSNHELKLLLRKLKETPNEATMLLKETGEILATDRPPSARVSVP
jgi:hypothetical protein